MRSRGRQAAAVRRVPPGLLNALPVHGLGPLGIVVVLRDVGPHKAVGSNATDAAYASRHPRELVHHVDKHPPPVNFRAS